MPTVSAAQTLPAHIQDARLSAKASFSAAQLVPAPAQAAVLQPEYLPDLDLSADQVVAPPTQRLRLVLATWRGPATPRPPGVPAVPRS
jgi:hypothetical protein